MSDRSDPKEMTPEALDIVQGGNLIDPWPTRVAAPRKRETDALFFDEADGVKTPGVVFEPNNHT